MKVAFVIPFRDRGKDPNRPRNLDAARTWLEHVGLGPVVVSGDGRDGDAQFNRSAAYNRGAAEMDADVTVFYESDLLVPRAQLVDGIRLAGEAPGLVVPFSNFMAVTERYTPWVRAEVQLGRIPRGLDDVRPEFAEQVRGDRKSTGAVNIVSRETLTAIGQWDEQMAGAWFDDDAMEIAFRTCAAPTRFVDGPGWHMYHLSGASGGHLTAEDRAATAANKARWLLYRAAVGDPEKIRKLTTGAL